MFRDVFGNTLVNQDEMDGLIPVHINTQSELNEWEQVNITEAMIWLQNKNVKTEEILTQNFIKQLHKKMFDKTWKCAGKFRQSGKNIGVDWYNNICAITATFGRCKISNFS